MPVAVSRRGKRDRTREVVMSNRLLSMEMGNALGMLGLFLMLVIARLANHAYEPQQTVADRLTSFLARRTIDGIAAIGWVADHLPAPAPQRVAERALQGAR
jgi:hypothetical protein